MCCCGKGWQCPTWAAWVMAFICSVSGHETVAAILLSAANIDPVRIVVIVSMVMIFMASTLVTVYRFLHRWRPYNYAALLLVLASMVMLIITYRRHMDITGNNDNPSPANNSPGCHFNYSSNKWVGCPSNHRRRSGGVFGVIVENGISYGIGAATSKSLLLALPVIDGIEAFFGAFFLFLHHMSHRE